MKEITNLRSIEKGLKRQRSTGVAEEGGQVLITGTNGENWKVLKGLEGEANLWSQIFCQNCESQVGPAEATPTSFLSSLWNALTSFFHRLLDFFRSKAPPTVDSDLEDIIGKAVATNEWDGVMNLLDDMILLINMDTGGQAEFLDLQASLVQGPSFNLLFSRLEDDFDKEFEIWYSNDEGESTEKEGSITTVEEVLFQTLSSIACYSGTFNDGDNDESAKHAESKVLFVGTHLDKVTPEKFEEKDRILQEMIKGTPFHDKGIIEYTKEGQLMLPVDNWNGDDEIDGIQTSLYDIIKRGFRKIEIPASWLLLSLLIRSRLSDGVRTISLEECQKIAEKVGISCVPDEDIADGVISVPDEKIADGVSSIPNKECKKIANGISSVPDKECQKIADKVGIKSTSELQKALLFLHHRMGVLLYYPELESLKGTVICDIQVVFNSATRLIKNTFTFKKVGEIGRKNFSEKGQFSLKDIKNATQDHTDDLIPLEKMIQLLDYLGILTIIPPPPGPDGNTPEVDPEPTYLMPCVLKSAVPSELKVERGKGDPAPLMLRFDCGYVPVGVFPSMIANLISQTELGWQLNDDEGIRKNKVKFRVGEDFDTVTLISHPRYLEIVISRSADFHTPTTSLCSHVCYVIEAILEIAQSRMNHHFEMKYKFGFKCPSCEGKEHLCVLDKKTARRMQCLRDKNRTIAIKDDPLKLEWFMTGEDGM
jgi:hypothetical protein